MASFLYRVGRFAFRRRWSVLVVWAVVVGGVVAIAMNAPAAPPDDHSIPGTEFSNTGDWLTIEVTDSGGAPPARAGAVPNSGYGLVGMRERAESVGGRLRAGPLPAGGFETVADLPLRSHRLDGETDR